MKHDLTTGTWQDDTGCPISFVLAATSDVCNFEFMGLFTNITSNLWEIWSFCNGHIRYYMVGPTRNFEVMGRFNHIISNIR
jgi:hypothetical protein